MESDKQKLFTTINGSGDGVDIFSTGAKCDAYYEETTKEEKLKLLERYADNFPLYGLDPVNLSDKDIAEVYEALEKEYSSLEEYISIYNSLA